MDWLFSYILDIGTKVALWFHDTFTNTIQLLDQFLSFFIYVLNQLSFTNLLGLAITMTLSMFNFLGLGSVLEPGTIFWASTLVSNIFDTASFVLDPWIPMAMVNSVIGILVIGYLFATCFRLTLWLAVKFHGNV